MSKRFFFVCAGILCLALAYHFGATSAVAQGDAKGKVKFVKSWGEYVCVVSDNDDIYIVDPLKLPNVAKGTGWWKFRLDAVK